MWRFQGVGSLARYCKFCVLIFGIVLKDSINIMQLTLELMSIGQQIGCPASQNDKGKNPGDKGYWRKPSFPSPGLVD
jgi:hypothetical protein